ncbi:hypothetical protein [Rhodococcoides fascians]|uniref:hypothetical protein n=1 Tax=Rhodococcoides fascians TaxID=1828 RepID=UPI00068B556E|nr:hypothetical protein [Rhodococcus fascians]
MRFDVRTFVVGLAVSLLTGQLVGTASADVVVDNPVHYVALGDSRAAGPAWLSYAGGDGCGRSDAAYPAMIASALHPVSFASVACTGRRAHTSCPRRRARTRHCLIVSRFRSMRCGLIRRW